MDKKLLETARQLGENLRQSQALQTYLKAAGAFEAQPQLAELEAQLLARYQDLAARQRGGEELPQKEVQDFYKLRNEVQKNPLIWARDNTLGAVKSLFSAAGTEITNQLGVDFTTLALTLLPDETEPAGD